MRADELKQIIESGLPDAQASVTGDGDHFEAVIVCPCFEGKGMIEQHRLVYGALGNRMQSEIHAFSMKTYTPDEWRHQAGRA